jgi:hypothetical protein
MSMGALHCERGEKDEKTTHSLGFECTVLTSAPGGWKSLWMETKQLTPLWMNQLIANVGFHHGQDNSPMLTRHTCHKHTGPAHLFYMNEMIKNDCDIKLHYYNMANSNFFPSKYGDLGHYLPPQKNFLWVTQTLLFVATMRKFAKKRNIECDMLEAFRFKMLIG